MRHPDIPKTPYSIFKRVCHSDFFEELQGDLEENFLQDLALYGKRKAQKKYWLEILKMMRPSVINKASLLPKRFGQLTRNYLLTSVRAVKHNPGYILSNVFGLALALSISTIGYFNFRFNHTFNEHYQEAPNLYKVHGLRSGEATLGASAITIGPALKTAGIQAVRYHKESLAVRQGNRLFQQSAAFADPEFLEAFELKNLSGQRVRLLSTDEIIISEQMAIKLFGTSYPVGELVHLVFPNQKEQSFRIKDVFKLPPRNVSFYFPMITSIENYLKFYELDESDWSAYIDGTFIHIPKGSPKQIETQLAEYVTIHNVANPDRQVEKFRLDNLLDWPAFEQELAGRSFISHLHPASVAGTVSTAFAILLLACFNFINTSIALSGKRLKEIAVRKVMGGNRGSTIAQFMTENSLMVLTAVVLSIGISYFLIPAYNSLLQQDIIQLDQVPVSTLVTFAIILIVLVALLSGAYPSFYISKFPSLQIFREKLVLSGKNRLMVVLLTFQFALCFYNFASLYAMVDNSYYQESLDRGYDVGKVINIPLYESDQFDELKDRLQQHPDVVSVSGTSQMIGYRFDRGSLELNGKDWDVADLLVGTSYLQTLGVRLIKGSFFADKFENSTNQIIINKMLEKQVGRDLLNQSIRYMDKQYTVVGVVEDFNLKPIMFDNRIKPTILRAAPMDSYNYAAIQITGVSDLVNPEVELIWYDLFPQQLYKGFLQEEVLDSIRETNTIMININLVSAIITILISALGLYTLIALIVQKRSKEFGIRKVLGASKSVIVNQLGKDIYWILGIAMILGLAASYYVMNLVFDIIYAYHISIGLWHLLLPSIGLFVIVIFTVGFKVMQTSKLNPVEQLRME